MYMMKNEETKMKLSEHTIEVLKNFAGINPNIVITPGQKLKTISEAKNILASAEINEDFPSEFGIYDLNEFLSVINLVGGKPNLDFENEYVYIQQDDKDPYFGSVKYFFAEKDILTTPQKDITMPDPEFSIAVSEESLNRIRKAAAVLGHSELAISGEQGCINATILDDKDATANIFKLELAANNDCTNSFNFVINISNLKFLPGDYHLSISSKLISHWQNTAVPVEYFVALEKTSEFHV